MHVDKKFQRRCFTIGQPILMYFHEHTTEITTSVSRSQRRCHSHMPGLAFCWLLVESNSAALLLQKHWEQSRILRDALFKDLLVKGICFVCRINSLYWAIFKILIHLIRLLNNETERLSSFILVKLFMALRERR